VPSINLAALALKKLLQEISPYQNIQEAFPWDAHHPGHAHLLKWNV
jgi:hypothetical protein